MKKIILGLVISGLILGGCSSKMDQFVEPQGTPRPSIEPLPTDASFAGEEWYDQMEVWQLQDVYKRQILLDQLPQGLADPILVVGQRDVIRACFYRFDGIAHRHAQATAFKHRQVVDAVADAQNPVSYTHLMTGVIQLRGIVDRIPDQQRMIALADIQHDQIVRAVSYTHLWHERGD